MKRWSKLQKEIENLFAEGLDLRIQCRAYRMDSQSGSTDLPRYWVTLGKQIIWDYPKDFKATLIAYPFSTDIGAISALLREYIDTPVDELLLRHFEDPWQLVEILLAGDRRMGARRREFLESRIRSPAAKAVLRARWAPNPRVVGELGAVDTRVE